MHSSVLPIGTPATSRDRTRRIAVQLTPHLSWLELLLGANVALGERIRQRRRHDEKLPAVVLE